MLTYIIKNYMKRILCVFIVILLINLLFSNHIFAHDIQSTEQVFGNTKKIVNITENQFDNSYRYNIKGWIYVHIEGDPYNRGFQYGFLLSDEITDLMTRWSNTIHNHPKIKSLNGLYSQDKYNKISKIWWEFCKSQALRMYWDEYPIEYKEEIKGIAAGVSSKGGTIHGEPVNYEDVLTSNQMYEIMSKLTDQKIRKGFHPLINLFNNLKSMISELEKISITEFMDDFSNKPEHHHCSSFIATGNATSDDQIIISNSMWSSSNGSGAFWWSNYIAIRWNVVLDVTPTTGNRFMMACAPGYIWSDHDFYQNDAGIVFIETTSPQGLWKERGLPLAVRARTAIQYSENIDDVIYYLRYLNDGVMNAVWLIGDTKTGEIARYELGLYNDAIIERTFDGFQWSANNPIDFGVRLEKLDYKLLLRLLIYKVVINYDGYKYHTPRYYPADRDIKFKELGDLYYGEIDVDIVKKIMATEPISKFSPDCKITSSELVSKNGIWVFTGNPMGKILEMENLDKNNLVKEEIKPVGWVRFYGLDNKEDFQLINQYQDIYNQPEVKWKYKSVDETNDFFSNSVILNNILYSTTSSGEILANDVNNGNLIWNEFIGDNPTTPTIYDNKIFFGTSNGLKMLDLGWMLIGEKHIGKIISQPVTYNGTIFVGNDNGNLYAFNISSGDELWNINLPDEIYISEVWNNTIYVGSGNSCHAIDIVNGLIKWFYETNGMITSRPYVKNSNVFFGSWDTYLHSIKGNNGEINWLYETGWGFDTNAISSDGIIYVGSNDNNFYAIGENNGNLIWSLSCNSGIHASPIVYNNNIIFGSDDGRIYNIEKNTGEIKWFFAPGDTIDDRVNYRTTPIISNFVVKSGILFFGANGYIYAILI
jgi:outer membrane protein assembly factor BamB